jgi:hypothetical protein
VLGGTAGTIAGTILIPVPILGATIGGTFGSVGGKLLGGVSGIALSKILEVYEKVKESKIQKMSTVPQLMSNLSPQSEMVRGLLTFAIDRDEEEKISNAVQEAMNLNSSSSSSSSKSPSLEDIVRTCPNATPDKYQAATQLSAELFTDSNAFDYFILTPVPDGNAPEEFASSTDLLVLRWPQQTTAPWDSNEEQVLSIDDLSVHRE